MPSAYLLVIACGVLALLYGLVTSRQVLTANAGSARMQEISGAVLGRRTRLSQPPISRDRGRWRRGFDSARGDPRRTGRHRLSDRGGAVGGGRLYRHECLSARQCQDGASRAQRPQGRTGDRLQGRRGNRFAGGRARAARGRDLLLRLAGDDARRQFAAGARGHGGAELWRFADLDFRPSRRRHLHQGCRCRRGPRRQGRGRHPGRRPTQPGGDRRQCRRQRRRLRRHGRRSVRNLCRDDCRDDAARRDLLRPAAARQAAAAAARDRRGVHRHLGDRHIFCPVGCR